MIIYVYERRVFQTNDFGLDKDLNLQIPMKAYECCPCEFEIDNGLWKGDYDQTFDDTTAISSKLSIKVKNVKTFYTNGLLNGHLDKIYRAQGKPSGGELGGRLDKMMIYDLMDKMDKEMNSSEFNQQVTTVQSMTLNGLRRTFMNRQIILANEEFGGYGINKRTWQQATIQEPLSWNKNDSVWKNLGDNLLRLTRYQTKTVMVGASANVKELGVGKVELSLNIFDIITAIVRTTVDFFTGIPIRKRHRHDAYSRMISLYGMEYRRLDARRLMAL